MRFYSSIQKFGILGAIAATQLTGGWLAAVQASPTLIAQLSFPDNPGGSGPKRTAGAGTRGECTLLSAKFHEMTVLMPSNNIGTTTDANTSIFIYIPQLATKGAELIGVSGDLVVVDEHNDEQFFGQFTLPDRLTESDGIVKLTLDGVNLEPDKTYEWSFSPYCVVTDRDEDGVSDRIPTVELQGQIQRVALDSEQAEKLTEAKTMYEKATLYTEAGVWNDAIDILANLRSTHADDWQTFLESVGLEHLANTPIYL
ncbi:MAG: DUF928 domain-containing protein [Jaaginema sp. PMC 1079.18]|nr:DUF928 domain-containing protein [Jaaginema sp. PMC 1080.18]MEC4852812.1 DUF928 domain-containing protein [Jaaginema sp. PMC 1079.18]MEC4866260.1 DUF928 domain-containing protein [Jaaginema sp. PMC 1078.18]